MRKISLIIMVMAAMIIPTIAHGFDFQKERERVREAFNGIDRGYLKHIKTLDSVFRGTKHERLSHLQAVAVIKDVFISGQEPPDGKELVAEAIVFAEVRIQGVDSQGGERDQFHSAFTERYVYDADNDVWQRDRGRSYDHELIEIPKQMSTNKWESNLKHGLMAAAAAAFMLSLIFNIVLYANRDRSGMDMNAHFGPPPEMPGMRPPVIEQPEPDLIRPAEITPAAEFTEIVTTHNQVDIAVIKSVFNEKGITYHIIESPLAGVDPCRVMVREPDAQKAAWILEDLKINHNLVMNSPADEDYGFIDDVKCPYCNDDFNGDTDTCGSCGKVIYQCPSCKTLVKEDAETCSFCGEPV